MPGAEYAEGGAVRSVSRVQNLGEMFGGHIWDKDHGVSCTFPAPVVRMVMCDGDAFLFSRDQATELAGALLDCLRDA